jgi:site-specific DNA recombinase
LLERLIQRVDLATTQMSMQLQEARLAKALDLETDDLDADALSLTVPITLRRRGIEVRIITGLRDSVPDPVLCRVLADATSWAKALRKGTSIVDLARDIGQAEAYIRTRLPIAFLAPRLQRAILEGRQSPDLSVARILRDGVPLDWDAQERRFGNP